MGSGTEAHEELAGPLGRWLARAGVHLLTGGGGGVMASVSRAFHETPGREGLVLGILRGGAPPGSDAPGYPNPWVEIAVRTHLPLSGARGTEPGSRNHINILTSDAVVALPGGEGTASEIRLAGQYGVPVVAWPGPVPRGARHPTGIPVVATIDEVADFLRRVVDRDTP